MLYHGYEHLRPLGSKVYESDWCQYLTRPKFLIWSVAIYHADLISFSGNLNLTVSLFTQFDFLVCFRIWALKYWLSELRSLGDEALWEGWEGGPWAMYQLRLLMQLPVELSRAIRALGSHLSTWKGKWICQSLALPLTPRKLGLRLWKFGCWQWTTPSHRVSDPLEEGEMETELFGGICHLLLTHPAKLSLPLAGISRGQDGLVTFLMFLNYIVCIPVVVSQRTICRNWFSFCHVGLTGLRWPGLQQPGAFACWAISDGP